MTLIAAPAPSWVNLTLDTTPPLVVLDAPSSVEPPDDLVVLVKANEDLGPVTLLFVDAYGVSRRVGYERTSPRLLTLRLPTMDLATGAGELLVLVKDTACNSTAVKVDIDISRPRAFDVVLSITHAQGVELTVDHAFEAEIEIGHAHTAALLLDHPFEGELHIDHSLDATLEIT